MLMNMVRTSQRERSGKFTFLQSVTHEDTHCPFKQAWRCHTEKSYVYHIQSFLQLNSYCLINHQFWICFYRKTDMCVQFLVTSQDTKVFSLLWLSKLTGKCQLSMFSFCIFFSLAVLSWHWKGLLVRHFPEWIIMTNIFSKITHWKLSFNF